jgi:uncharacterized membrane protein/co-chaperonin GroES (HSP10)
MADLDITIRRKNGAGYDVLHPTTIISQVTGLQTALDAKIATSARGAANGVAPLDSNSKVPVANLPGFITGAGRGFYLVGTISGSVSLTGVGGIVQELAGAIQSGGSYENAYGYFWVASGTVTLTWTDQTTLNPNQLHVILPGDEGDTTSPVTLETGDQLVFTKYSATAGTGDDEEFTFSVINNTYQNATTSAAGITTLSASTSTATTGNNVITDGILNGLVTTTVGTANKLMAAAHNHDGTYLGISATAANATKLATARTIAASGDGTWSVSFDGSANVTAGLTLATVATAGTYKSVTVNAKGLVTSGTNPTTLSGYGITDAQPLDADLTSIAGLAGTTGFLKKTAANTFTLDTASYLTGNQSISVSGDASGSGTTSIALTLATVATAGTYRSVTVNAKGLVTSGTNPTTISGYGITDAYTETEVDNLLLNRPEIYYNAAGNSDGDIILDLDSDGAIS